MPQDIIALASALVEAARKAGATAADALVVENHSLSVDVLKGRLEAAERAEGIDLGVRVLVGQRQACVSASNASAQTVSDMAERAVAMAREAPEDPFAGLADPDQLAQTRSAQGLDLNDPQDEPEPAHLQDLALQAEAAALAVKGVAQVQSAGAGHGRQRLAMAASNGFAGDYARSSTSVSCVAISGTGLSMERDYFGESRVHRADLPDASGIGTTAGERAAARAGASKPPTGAFPVIFDERISAGQIGHLAAAASGSAIARGASWLRHALGEPVLPRGMDLVEDPLRQRVSTSRPFDAEGLPTASRKLVDDGTLTGWTLDLGTARKLGLQSTANAARGTGGPPSPGLTGLTLTPGTLDHAGLLAEMGTGLLVTSLIGSSINATTGDYSRGASGFWVEGGQIIRPVNECTIAGNLRDMLAGIVAANDARLHASWRVPSLLVEGLTIAGA